MSALVGKEPAMGVKKLAENIVVTSFDPEETMAFSAHINQCLGHDELLRRHLPLDIDSMDLFTKSSDGLIFCKLINLASRDAIDERALNTKEGMNVYQKSENLNLALNAARAIGCQVINIGSQDLIEGRPVLVLGLIWQIIKIQLLSMISLKNYPELVVLFEEGETMSSFLKLHPELILLRWLNYHLKKGGSSRIVNNFTNDLSDSEVYSIVLHRLNSSIPLVTQTNPMDRANQVIANAVRLGTNAFLQPKDICDGNKKLNISFVAQIFNTCHGLLIGEEEITAGYQLPDLSTLEIDDAGDSREERVFRMWINSLNIEGLYVSNLFSDLENGTAMLQVFDKMLPGVINWRRVNKDPPNRFKKVENANYIIELGKQMKFTLINVGPLDIVDGNQKIILAIIWQAMRKYTLSLLEGLATRTSITSITDDHIVHWANSKVADCGRTTLRMRNFRDTNLKDSLFLLELVYAIESRAVNWDLVTQGISSDDQMANAKYVISNARKVGACVFLTPEDIIEVKSKMILTFVASLWIADISREELMRQSDMRAST
eukprot:gene15488-20902_t